jgi:hypothetical protein
VLGQLTVTLDADDQLALTWLAVSYADVHIELSGPRASLISSARTAVELELMLASACANEALLKRAKGQRRAMMSELLR